MPYATGNWSLYCCFSIYHVANWTAPDLFQHAPPNCDSCHPPTSHAQTLTPSPSPSYPGPGGAEHHHRLLVALSGLAIAALLDQGVALHVQRRHGLKLLILLHHPGLPLVRHRVTHLEGHSMGESKLCAFEELALEKGKLLPIIDWTQLEWQCLVV